MQNIKPTTTNEKKLNQAVQKELNITPDGEIGLNTWTSLAFSLDSKFVDEALPLTLKLYGHPTIIGNDLLAWSPKAPLKGFANSMLGSFTYPRATTPCSILINNGKVICGSACHAWLGKPESVIYRLKDGTFGIKRVKSSSELPNNVKWAVGGMGLLDMYDPEAEGFTGQYADVLRKTNHNVLGIKNGKVYGVYYENMTGQQINAHCKNWMRFDYALLLDGGGLAAMNGTEPWAKINVGCKQGYALQFIK